MYPQTEFGLTGLVHLILPNMSRSGTRQLNIMHLIINQRIITDQVKANVNKDFKWMHETSNLNKK